MTARERIDLGPAIAMLGALLLIVSLFLDWYEPGLTAWTVFEVLDVMLAALAVGCLLGAAARLGLDLPGGRALESHLVVLAVLALVLVLSQVINHPPAAVDRDPETGLWLSLAGAGLMGLGGLLSVTRISFAVDVEGRGPGPPGELADLRRSGGPGRRNAGSAGGRARGAPWPRAGDESPGRSHARAGAAVAGGGQDAVPYVAVVGPGEGSADELAAAEEVGRSLAERGAVVVCGGLGGAMEAACRGARGAGGTTVGILPGTDRSAANPYVDVAVATGLAEGRNALVVRSADAVIAVGGAYGTLSEIALALRAQLPVIGLGTWELLRQGRSDGGITTADTADQAVELAFAALSAS